MPTVDLSAITPAPSASAAAIAPSSDAAELASPDNSMFIAVVLLSVALALVTAISVTYCVVQRHYNAKLLAALDTPARTGRAHASHRAHSRPISVRRDHMADFAHT